MSYPIATLTARQQQALRAAYDAAAGQGPALKSTLFKVLNERGFWGSAAAGVVTSLRQKANPFEVYDAEFYKLKDAATRAAVEVEYNRSACAPPSKPHRKAVNEQRRQTLSQVLSEPVQVRGPRKTVSPPSGYGDLSLDRIDHEDGEQLYGKPQGYIRGWNAVKLKRGYSR